MAIQRDSTYPGRWGAADADYPGGIPKNRTTPDSADGSYLEERLWKDTFGFMDAAIAQGDITRSDTPETATASDVLDGIKAVTAGQALTWLAARNYTHPVIVAGSDDELYVSKQDSGPATTVQDPTTDASDTYWELLADKIRSGFTPGTLLYWPSDTPPSWALERDGSALDATTYPELFAEIGYTFGGSGGMFNLPDDRGNALRGWDNGRGIDSGRVFGSEQLDQMQQITGRVRVYGGEQGAFTAGAASGNFNGGTNSFNYADFDSANSPGARVGDETRMRNRAYLPIIVY